MTLVRHRHHVYNNTSCNLVPAGTQRLKEAEAIDGDQSGGVENTQLFVLRVQKGSETVSHIKELL